MESGDKAMLYFLLIVAASFLLYVQINSYIQIAPSLLTSTETANFFAEIFGLGLLFVVICWIIWAIPETTTKSEEEKNNREGK
jgi:hypothetical protein